MAEGTSPPAETQKKKKKEQRVEREDPCVDHEFCCTACTVLAAFPFTERCSPVINLHLCLIKHYALKAYGGVDV
jgi:hypothetical protein